MKNILTKIYIHPLTYIIILVSFFTGYFKQLFTLLTIILIHELGHVLISQLLKWNIEKIVILPFGGITIFNELLNKPLIEEFLILIAGPLFQLIFYLLFNNINIYFNPYNYGLFIFNFLPIYPLDGYKLWMIIFSKYLPYKVVNYLMLIISLIFIILGIKLNLVNILIYLFLLIGLIKEYINLKYKYNKFLLERYLYKFNFKKIKNINNINYFYKDYYHYIKLMPEEKYLEICFKK